MKTCPNCRTIHDDDYMGTCQDCGKGLGSVQPNGVGGGDLMRRYADQRRRAARDDAFSPEAMRAARGRVDAPIEQGILDVASRFIVVDEKKLAELEAKDA